MEVFSAGILLYTTTNMICSLVLITDDGEVQTIEFPPHVSQVKALSIVPVCRSGSIFVDHKNNLSPVPNTAPQLSASPQ